MICKSQKKNRPTWEDSQWAEDAMSSFQQVHCVPFKARDSQVIAFQWLWQLSPPERPKQSIRELAWRDFYETWWNMKVLMKQMETIEILKVQLFSYTYPPTPELWWIVRSRAPLWQDAQPSRRHAWTPIRRHPTTKRQWILRIPGKAYTLDTLDTCITCDSM